VSVTPRQAIAFVRRAVAAGRVEFSRHVLEESMPDDDVSVDDVLHLLANSHEAACQNETETKWKFYGQLVNDTEYAAVCLFKDNTIVIVVTSHPPP
jgi:hypothetical protein